MSDPRFVCVVGPYVGRSYGIPQQRAVIGRSHGCDVYINSDTISRKHAELAYDGSILSISDLASRNSVKVNGTVIASADLKHGDLVTLGSIVLRVEWPTRDGAPHVEEEWTTPTLARRRALSPWLSMTLLSLVLLAVGGMLYKSVTTERNSLKSDVTQPALMMTLHEAAAANDYDGVYSHLKAGAKVNRKNEDGLTPLHLAASNGNEKMIRLLLNHGADANIKANDGSTAADFADAANHKTMAELIRNWKSKR